MGSRHRGTGWVLSLVHSLVELHSGTVSIGSAIGRGTTVTFPTGEADARSSGVTGRAEPS